MATLAFQGGKQKSNVLLRSNLRNSTFLFIKSSHSDSPNRRCKDHLLMGGLSRLALDQEDIVFTNTICLDAYMCLWERERGRDRERDTHIHRDSGTDRGTERDGERLNELAFSISFVPRRYINVLWSLFTHGQCLDSWKCYLFFPRGRFSFSLTTHLCSESWSSSDHGVTVLH